MTMTTMMKKQLWCRVQLYFIFLVETINVTRPTHVRAISCWEPHCYKPQNCQNRWTNNKVILEMIKMWAFCFRHDGSLEKKITPKVWC